MMTMIIQDLVVGEEGEEIQARPPGPPKAPQQEMDKITRSLIIFVVIHQTFLHITLESKILKFLLEKIMKNLLINNLDKDKEKFQICQKELLIKENRA